MFGEKKLILKLQQNFITQQKFQRNVFLEFKMCIYHINNYATCSQNVYVNQNFGEGISNEVLFYKNELICKVEPFVGQLHNWKHRNN